ncbi:MAG: hypothetical protein ACRD50_08605 [Candidatus Acidiferrales bacterium]
MKSKILTAIITVIFLAALAMALGVAAQDNATQNHKTTHHTYKLVDLGTFGGPQSYFVNDGVPSGSDLNNGGMLTGFADTSAADPFPPFCFNGDCFVSHAFQWKNGVRTDLGVLHDGLSSATIGISANGLIAGFADNGEIDPNVPVGFPPGFPELRAVIWRNGEITDLGVLPEGGTESVANALNSRGQVVGAALNTIADPNSIVLCCLNAVAPFALQTRAFLWDEENGMQDLGTLGGTDAMATLINDKGQVVGFSYTGSNQAGACFPLATDSFIWEKEKGMTDLGSFGGTCTVAGAVNNRGQVVGSSNVPGDLFGRAFLWEHGSFQDLGGSLGGNGTGASAINDHGQVVGAANLAGETFFHASLWRHVGEITDLGTLGSDTCSFASSINARGQVVGDSKPGCGPDSDRGFLWENGSIFDLNTLIPAGSALYLQFIDTINDRGEITGTGADVSGNEHAFLLIPCDENHPGIEGCDYSPVDAATAAEVSPNVWRRNPNAEVNVAQKNLLRNRFGRRFALPGPRPVPQN